MTRAATGDAKTDRIGVLFVCLGNICRSPLAEGVFRDVADAEGLAGRFDIDSAGTSDYHTGDPPDPRTVGEAKRRGLVLEHSARQIRVEDFARFDYVIAMDASNLGKIERLAKSMSHDAELHLLRAFDGDAGDDLEVPDPYFGGPDGFSDVHDMVERSCRTLLEHIRSHHAL
ncbi:MAG: low molecular weight phosphotyrosine protein phosphatase [Gemmatimonadetes bacterium]|nr:low molecular weight phosphotyrosine protein phosphatase [Gemmatimonadota bacterium]